MELLKNFLFSIWDLETRLGFAVHENFSNWKEFVKKVREFIEFAFSAFFDQVYDGKLQQLKKQSLDLRVRLREHKERPKALEMLRNSLNLSRTFLVQITNITDKDEIYTAKDLEELGKVINDTTVRCISLNFLRNVTIRQVCYRSGNVQGKKSFKVWKKSEL